MVEASVNAAELADTMITAKRDIDDAFTEYEKAILEAAKADREAKLAKATAYLATSGTVAERNAHMDKATADEQYRAKLAEDKRRAMHLLVEHRRQWLSALQSLASLTKAEAQLAAWEPKEVA